MDSMAADGEDSPEDLGQLDHKKLGIRRQRYQFLGILVQKQLDTELVDTTSRYNWQTQLLDTTGRSSQRQQQFHGPSECSPEQYSNLFLGCEVYGVDTPWCPLLHVVACLKSNIWLGQHAAVVAYECQPMDLCEANLSSTLVETPKSACLGRLCQPETIIGNSMLLCNHFWLESHILLFSLLDNRLGDNSSPMTANWDAGGWKPYL